MARKKIKIEPWQKTGREIRSAWCLQTQGFQGDLPSQWSLRWIEDLQSCQYGLREGEPGALE